MESLPAGAVSPEDIQVINSGPAPFANKMFATNYAEGMRLTFVEINPGAPEPAFRSAVFLGYNEAFALLGLLQKQLAALGQRSEDVAEPQA